MFKFLKKKISDAVSKFTRKVEEEAPEEVVETGVEALEEQSTEEIESPVEEVKETDSAKEDPSESTEADEDVAEEIVDEFEDIGKVHKLTPSTIHALADSKNISWDDDPNFLQFTFELTGKKFLDDLTSEELSVVEKAILDGKLPVVKEKPIDELRKTVEEREEKSRPAVIAPQPRLDVGNHEIEPERITLPKEPKSAIVLNTIKYSVEKPGPDVKTETTQVEIVPVVEKKGFFARMKEKIVTKKLSSSQFNELFEDIEMALLENNVAFEVIEKMKADLAGKLVDKSIQRSKVSTVVMDTLHTTVSELLSVEAPNLLSAIAAKKPFILCFVGINGGGKTTTIGKYASYLKTHGVSSVMAAGDTFRAAAIQQLEEHAKNVGVKMIKHDYGSDSAAVAFDAIKYATSHKVDVVLIDTAGRLHSNINLMDELKKLVRVAKPDFTIFVGESITGNDCVEQAQKFNEAVGINGIILTKADVDEKGGAALSISYVTGKPILFFGVGQKYEDLEAFDKGKVMESIGL